MVFNTDKSVETEIMIQDSIHMIYETYHGNMSRKPLIDIVSMIRGPVLIYTYGKNRNRRYCQSAKTVFH